MSAQSPPGVRLVRSQRSAEDLPPTHHLHSTQIEIVYPRAGRLTARNVPSSHTLLFFFPSLFLPEDLFPSYHPSLYRYDNKLVCNRTEGTRECSLNECTVTTPYRFLLS